MKRARVGLTLLELIVALAITGLVIGAGYSALGGIIDTRRRAEQVYAAAASSAALRRTLERWLSGAELVLDDPTVAFQGFDGVHLAAPADELTFRTSAETPGVPSGSTIRLFIDRADSARVGGLVAIVTPERHASGQRIELWPAVGGLDMRYLDGIRGGRAWTTSWVSRSVLPAAIELTLTAPAHGTLAPVLSLPLTVPLGASR
ncbi:MAG: type II secretion system protein [Gemmatimonadaceae bacterium]|nr:type II secretion system protein [Gemmatimonadaceae bacterium]